MLSTIVFGITFTLAFLAHLREQAEIGRPYQIVIEVVELVILAFDVERSEVDGPIIGLHQINTDAPIVERQIEAELLLADLARRSSLVTVN
jgi:hypothetical protein